MPRRFFPILPALSLAILLPGCMTAFTGSNINTGKNDNVKKTAQVTGQVNLVVNAVNYNQAARRTQAIVTANTNNKTTESIMSGPPEQMVLYLKSITGDTATGSVNFWTSSLPGGTPISLQSGNVDLASLNLGQLSVPVGNYSRIDLEFARVGQIKGCVQGTFRWTNPATTSYYVNSPAAGAANLYTSEPSVQGKTETFATRADKSQLSVETFSTASIGCDADFDPALNGKTDSELTEVDLDGSNDCNQTVAQIRQSNFGTSSTASFSVDQTNPITLTLAVDLNRMLRFYTNTRTDLQPPCPAMKAGTSYFFTTMFKNAISVFAGSIGSVEGYQLASNGYFGWLTVFRDASGSVLKVGGFPDDDNNMAIVKGDGENITGDLDNGLAACFSCSSSIISGFKSIPLGASASATVTYTMTDPRAPYQDGQQFPVIYQRML